MLDETECNMNIILLLGGILGLSSVMMAAYVDHSLGASLSVKALSSMLTAVRYHQLYALLITIIGIYLPLQTNYRCKLWLVRAAAIFLIGIVLFSASIYSAYIFGISFLTSLAPIGGTLLMLGWVCLIRLAFLYNNKY